MILTPAESHEPSGEEDAGEGVEGILGEAGDEDGNGPGHHPEGLASQGRQGEEEEHCQEYKGRNSQHSHEI